MLDMTSVSLNVLRLVLCPKLVIYPVECSKWSQKEYIFCCLWLESCKHRWLLSIFRVSSVQFSSVAQLCPTLCDPMNRSTPGLLYITISRSSLRFMSTESRDSYLTISSLPPTSPAFNLSQHQGLFKWVSSSHQVAKVLEFQLQHQSFQWIFRTDFL